MARALGRRGRPARPSQPGRASWQGFVNWQCLGVVVGLLVAWQLLVAVKVLDFQSLPGPSGIVSGLGQLLSEDSLWGPLGHTLLAVLIAWALAVAVGTLLGLAVGLMAPVAAWASPAIDLFRSLPVIAFVPIAILIWGPATEAEVLVAAYAAVWPMLVNTSRGVAAVGSRLHDVARTFRLSPIATIWKIIIPAAVGPMLVGARIALGITIVVAVVTEMIGPPLGLGYGLITAQNAEQPAQMWALVLVVGVVGVLANALLVWLSRAAFPAVTATPGGGAAHGAPRARRRPRGQGVRATSLGELRGVAPIIVALGLWQLLGDPRSPTLPSPSAWWQAVERLRQAGQLWHPLETTLLLFLAGLVLATLIGVVLGTALGSSRRLMRATGPLLEFLRTTPAPAIVPGVILLFGANTPSDIGVIVYGAVWPILLNTASARSALPAARLDVASSLNLSRPARMLKIIAPSLLPGILTGVRVATPICLIMTLLADFLLTSGGLGQSLVQLQQAFDASGTLALLAVIGLLGLLLNAVIASAERLMLRHWPAGAG